MMCVILIGRELRLIASSLPLRFLSLVTCTDLIRSRPENTPATSNHM
jgi:hypothetical protein